MSRNDLIAAAFFATIAGFMPSAAVAQHALESAGSVISVTPADSVTVRHDDGTTESAHYGLALRPLDRFEFVRDAVLSAYVYNDEAQYNQNSVTKTIPPRAKGFRSGQDDSYFDRFMLFLGTVRQAIPVFPSARDAHGAPPPTLVASPILPAGVQYILPTTRTIALVWDGGAGIPRVRTVQKAPSTPAGRSAPTAPIGPVDASRSAWALLDFGDAGPDFSVELPGQALGWNVQVATNVPHPAWQPDAGAVLSDEQRLVRAAWILDDGDGDSDRGWRMFALSELAELAERGNFAASQLWIAARSGELDRFNKKMTGQGG